MPTTLAEGGGGPAQDDCGDEQQDGRGLAQEPRLRPQRATKAVHLRPGLRQHHAAAIPLRNDGEANHRQRAAGVQRHRVCVRPDWHRQVAHNGRAVGTAGSARHHSAGVPAHLRPDRVHARPEFPRPRLVSGDLQRGGARPALKGPEEQARRQGGRRARCLCEGSHLVCCQRGHRDGKCVAGRQEEPQRRCDPHEPRLVAFALNLHDRHRVEFCWQRWGKAHQGRQT